MSDDHQHQPPEALTACLGWFCSLDQDEQRRLVEQHDSPKAAFAAHQEEIRTWRLQQVGGAA